MLQFRSHPRIGDELMRVVVTTHSFFLDLDGGCSRRYIVVRVIVPSDRRQDVRYVAHDDEFVCFVLLSTAACISTCASTFDEMK